MEEYFVVELFHDSSFPGGLSFGHGASIPATAATLNDRASSFLARDATIAQTLRWTLSPTYCASSS